MEHPDHIKRCPRCAFPMAYLPMDSIGFPQGGRICLECEQRFIAINKCVVYRPESNPGQPSHQA